MYWKQWPLWNYFIRLSTGKILLGHSSMSPTIAKRVFLQCILQCKVSSTVYRQPPICACVIQVLLYLFLLRWHLPIHFIFIPAPSFSVVLWFNAKTMCPRSFSSAFFVGLTKPCAVMLIIFIISLRVCHPHHSKITSTLFTSTYWWFMPVLQLITSGLFSSDCIKIYGINRGS